MGLSQSYETTSAFSLGATTVLLAGHRTEVGWLSVVNTTAAAAYLQLFDAAATADVTLGTTLPTLSVQIAASGQTTLTNVSTIFRKGIVVASTTTATGNTGATTHTFVGVG